MRFLKIHAIRFTSILIILFTFSLVKIQASDNSEISFNSTFTKSGLYIPTDKSLKNIRDVNPSLKPIDAWISSVGASAAINDIDNDGISNDVCHVDPRYNTVSIQTANKKDTRYKPFSLELSNDYYDETMAPMGCLPGDVNEDGLIDIVVYYWGRTPVAFIQEKNVGHFTAKKFRVHELVDLKEKWYTNAATFADIDGDGHKDLLIGNYFPDGSKILDKNALTKEHMQDSMSKALNGGENKVLLWKKPTNNSPIEYSIGDTQLPPEVLNGWTLALGAVDVNGDQLPEIYFANDFGEDKFLLNKSKPGKLKFEVLVGESDFAIPKSSVLGKDSFKGMGVDFGDINGDGIFDLYVSNIADEYALLESHFMFVSNGTSKDFKNGKAPYKNESEKLGLSRSSWGWDSKLIDFNNDGNLEAIQATGFVKGNENKWVELQEIAMSNDSVLKDPKSWPDITEGSDLSGNAHNPFFVKNNNGKFIDLAKKVGIDEPQVTRGIASGDIDADGDIDFVYANQWEDSFLYKNNCSKCEQSLLLNLKMPINKKIKETIISSEYQAELDSIAAVGAIVKVSLTNGQVISNYVDGGNGHSGKRSHEVHFGLGKEKIKKVEIQWRGLDGKIKKENLKIESGIYTIYLKN